MYRRSLALSWAARGAWDSAYVAAGEMLSGGAGERRSPEPLPLRGVRPVARCGRSRRGGDCRAAQRHRLWRACPRTRDADAERATLAWLDGLVAVTEGDRRGLAAARAAAQQQSRSAAAYIVRTLRALALRFGGSAAQLGEALVAADAGEKWDESGPEIRTQVLSINRLAEADAFLAAGDTARAQRLLVWHEADLNRRQSHAAAVRAARLLPTGEDRAGAGPVALAREHYHQFLRRYDQPVPSLRPLVEQARSALATIETAGRGS